TVPARLGVKRPPGGRRQAYLLKGGGIMSPFRRARHLLLLATAALVGLPAAAADWAPTKPVEFIVPAGTGGGADQMARLLQAIVQKHDLMKQPLIVVNKSGGAGAEGFLAIKD